MLPSWLWGHSSSWDSHLGQAVPAPALGWALPWQLELGPCPGAVLALLPGTCEEGGAGSGFWVLGRGQQCPAPGCSSPDGLSLVPRAVNGFDQGPPGLGGSRPSSAPGMLPLSV